MTQSLSTRKPSAPLTVEQALVQGDLSGLDAEQRVNYYLKVCSSLSLNALTKPFEYIVLNGKLTLYARKDCTDQLRKIHRVNITGLEHKQVGELMLVTAAAATPDGRRDSATGAVSIQGLKGDALANAVMKCETKAKRRVTLSICGLGMTDESEVDSIPDAYFPEPAPDEGYTPMREQDPPDADIIRRGDDRVWQRYLHLIDQAHELGLNPPMVKLPVDREELKIRGTELVEAIEERREQLDQEEAARIVAQANEAAAEAQRTVEGLQ